MADRAVGYLALLIAAIGWIALALWGSETLVRIFLGVSGGLIFLVGWLALTRDSA